MTNWDFTIPIFTHGHLGGLMKTDRGLIVYLQDLKPSDVSGEIAETEFDRWLEKACKLPDKGWVHYDGEWIKYKNVDGEVQILERRSDLPEDEGAD